MALAFPAAARVTDPREGLIAEVILLFAALAGIGLLVYGLTARRGLSAAPRPPARALDAAPPLARSRRDLLTGAGGVALGAGLMGGLASSGGVPLLAPRVALVPAVRAGRG